MTAPGTRFHVALATMMLAVSAASLVVLADSHRTATPHDEVAAAYAKLSATPHRKRETVLGPMAAMGGTKPMVTDVVGHRTRLVYEVDLPRFGTLRTERISVGARSAVRTTAPGVLAMIEKARTKATVSSVRSLLNQIVSVAAAIQTGGLSTANSIQQAINAAATMKSAADARRVLDQAADAFNSWQLVPPDELDAEFGPMPADAASFAMDVTFVGEEKTKSGMVRKYHRRPPGGFPGMPTIVETLRIEVATGLPLSEETSMDGKPMFRIDYFDHGAADVAIDVPECLR